MPQCDATSLGRRLALAGAAAAVLALAACAHAPGRDAIVLHGVIHGREVVPPERIAAGQLRVLRNGAPLPLTRALALRPGDRLLTGADTYAMVVYPSGARAYVYPDSRMRIGSIVAEIGKVFVKVRGLFNVSTTFVTAGSEGTQYWVTVDSGDRVSVVTVQDSVKLSSNPGRWPPRSLRPGDRAAMLGDGGPQMSTATPDEIKRETDWVDTMDRLLPLRAGGAAGY